MDSFAPDNRIVYYRLSRQGIIPMIQCSVKKGKHRFFPNKWALWVFPKKLSTQVIFDFDCRYNIGGNQTDINKLFGVGWFPHHHRNSARWGWRWCPEKEKIELFAYIYSNKKRISEYIDDVSLGNSITLTINIYKNRYAFIIEKKNRAPVAKMIDGITSFIGYRLGAYFGGNVPAPHGMTILISNGND
jgi:hypothetical protein